MPLDQEQIILSIATVILSVVLSGIISLWVATRTQDRAFKMGRQKEKAQAIYLPLYSEMRKIRENIELFKLIELPPKSWASLGDKFEEMPLDLQTLLSRYFGPNRHKSAYRYSDAVKNAYDKIGNIVSIELRKVEKPSIDDYSYAYPYSLIDKVCQFVLLKGKYMLRLSESLDNAYQDDLIKALNEYESAKSFYNLSGSFTDFVDRIYNLVEYEQIKRLRDGHKSHIEQAKRIENMLGKRIELLQ